jgi:hypothetical protein
LTITLIIDQPLFLQDCNGNDNQKWNYDSKSYTISYAKDSSKCVELKGGNDNSGTPVDITDCKKSEVSQQWVYNSQTQQFQYRPNLKKCIDLVSGLCLVRSLCNAASQLLDWGQAGQRKFAGYLRLQKHHKPKVGARRTAGARTAHTWACSQPRAASTW